MRSVMRSAAATITALLGATHTIGAETAGGTGLRVVASIPPIAGLVRELIPEAATLTTLAAPGQSEHGFELSPAAVDALARADVVFLVGMEMEPQVEKTLAASATMNPGRTVVRFADEIGEAGEGDASHDHHDHAPGQAHVHTGPDPHLWLDPRLAGAFVAAASEAILARLTAMERADAQSVASLKAARHDALRRITSIEGEYSGSLEPLKGAWLVTQHDAFGRLAERFGLRPLALTTGGEGGEPTPAALARVAALARAGEIRAVFVEPQSDPRSMERLAKAAGAKALTLDPLGDGDWFALMRANLEALKEGLTAPKAP